MERSEPSFVPEWYKGSSNTTTGSNNSNNNSGSLLSDEHTSGFSSRNRLSLSVCDHDAPHSVSSSNRNSFSFQRSANCNGSLGWEDFPSRGYNSCGRSHHGRVRDRDREKDLGFLERDRSLFLDNGSSHYADSFNTKPSEKDSLKRSQSLVSRRQVESWLRRPGYDSSNGTLSGGSIVSGIIKSSFERDFPSLGVDEKQLGSDLSRVSSPGISTAIDILPLSVSALNGGDGWTSALAEVPLIAGVNGQLSSSALQTNHTSANSSTISGLNMAETLALVPERVRTVVKLPNDSQKIEELHRQQIMKLRPVTSSMLKGSVPNSADKSKTKGPRIAEFSSIKQPSPSHLLTHTSVRSEPSKASLPAQFQVLNRGRNGFSPNSRDIPSPTNVSRVPTSSGAVNPSSKDPANPKLKVDAKDGDSILRACGEKKIPSQVQKRNDFFNSLRKKASVSQPTNANDDLTAVSSISSKLASPPENGNCLSDGCSSFEEPEKLAPDEEEAAFLRSLGWEENAGEEALTREEIESFLSEYKKRRPASKLNV